MQRIHFALLIFIKLIVYIYLSIYRITTHGAHTQTIFKLFALCLNYLMNNYYEKYYRIT